MDTIEKTEIRNYRGFTITNPSRGNWWLELNGWENSAKTYKEAMAKIDRMFLNYDNAAATLAEMGEEPTVPAQVQRYRDLQTAFQRAQDKVTASSGVPYGSLWSMRETTLEDELAKTEAMIEHRTNAIAALQEVIAELRTFDEFIQAQEQSARTAEYRWSMAEETVRALGFLAL